VPPPAAVPGGTVLALVGPADDFAVLAERAARHDATCPVRLVAADGVLAAFVPTPFDCLGMRAARLRISAGLDVVVEAVGLAALARVAGADLQVPLALPALRWTLPSPPRTGWSVAGTLTVADLAARVAADTEEFRHRAAAVPPGRNASAAVAAIAGELWARPLAADHAARLAHAASYLGFLPDHDAADPVGARPGGDGPVTLRTAGPWRRLDTPLGVTLARASSSLGLLAGAGPGDSGEGPGRPA
jgi:hypothetical protein